jgi:hypothetical protein
VLATGTLRALLLACGWRLERAGLFKSRGADRDAYKGTPEKASSETL